MTTSFQHTPDPRFEALGPEFADSVQAARFPAPVLRFRNARASAQVGLDTLTPQAWEQAFAQFKPLPANQSQPLAMRYHGHQFRSYNPDLGDGRGFLFAQLRDQGGRLLDLGTKGSGQTPYSRFGDGRLTLKGGVREVLAAAMLEALGVPTSRAFALFETGEALQRHDEPSPTRASVLTRLSHSHIRFGTFQRHAHVGRPDLVEILIDHVLQTYYPELAPAADDRAAALLGAVVERSARLTAAWMAAGFVHGVLNTDNMNITGESFDYGPYRFLPYSDPDFVAAYFDETGLYRFGRQPEAVFWNLQQLAVALAGTGCARDPLGEALNGFGATYRRALTQATLARLGVEPRSETEDEALATATYEALAEAGPQARWEPFFFDWFGGLVSEGRAMGGPRGGLYRGEAAGTLRRRLSDYEARESAVPDGAYFAAADPEELLYDEIEAIWAPIAADDDWSLFERKLERIEQARLAWGLAREPR